MYNVYGVHVRQILQQFFGRYGQNVLVQPITQWQFMSVKNVYL